MTDQTCPSCSGKSADGLLCSTETAWLRKDLRNLPMWLDQLAITHTRQGQTGPGNGGKAAETPLPFDAKASELMDEVINTITTWVRLFEDDGFDVKVPRCTCVVPYVMCRGYVMELDTVPNTMTGWTTWLAGRINQIRGHEAVPEFAKAMSSVVRKVQRKVDTAPPQLFCGPCDICGTDLYAPIGKEEIVCRRCAEVALPEQEINHYDVADRRAWLLGAVRSRLATAQEILTAVPEMFGVEINSGTFRSWVTRGRLEPRGSRDGKALYSVDAALNLAEEVATRRPKRRTQHAGVATGS